MLVTNVRIIEVLRSFLDTVAADPATRKLFTLDGTDFSRDRKLPFQKVVGMLVNLPKRSLAIELRSFYECLGQPGLGCTKAAFSQQRAKLRPVFFSAWNRLVTDLFYGLAPGRVERWEGHRLFAVDGSSFNVVDVPAVSAHFGTAGNQSGGVPMARAVQVRDVLNGLVLWGGIFPIADSETAITARHLHQLPGDGITLFDRGFPSYWLMYLLDNEEVAKKFVIRCKVSFSHEVRDFVASGAMDAGTVIYPTDESVKLLKGHGYIVTRGTGLRVRMVRAVLPGGEVEVLLTNLHDTAVFPTGKMGALYFMRWGIETGYDCQKNKMQMEICSGHRVVCIEQDYAAGIFVANLQAIIEAQCGEGLAAVSAGRGHAYKVNRNVAIGTLKDRVVGLFLGTRDATALLAELGRLFLRDIEPVRPGRRSQRPKRKLKRGKYHPYTNYRRSI